MEAHINNRLLSECDEKDVFKQEYDNIPENIDFDEMCDMYYKAVGERCEKIIREYSHLCWFVFFAILVVPTKKEEHKDVIRKVFISVLEEASRVDGYELDDGGDSDALALMIFEAHNGLVTEEELEKHGHEKLIQSIKELPNYTGKLKKSSN